MTGGYDIQLVLLDLVGTVLDLSALDAPLERAFGKPGLRETWLLLGQEIQLTSVITGRYKDLPTVFEAALQVLAKKQGMTLSSGAVESILNGLKQLPAFPDVVEAIEIFRQSGCRVAVLTNSPMSSARQQLDNAGLHRLLDKIISADDVKRLKPAPEPYVLATTQLGVTTKQTLLVSAHSWDITGAQSVGCLTGFVARPGKVITAAVVVPTYQADDLVSLARHVSQTTREGKLVTA